MIRTISTISYGKFGHYGVIRDENEKIVKEVGPFDTKVGAYDAAKNAREANGWT